MQHQNWKQIVWREWRHCHDIDYEAHLFKIVADDPTGWSSRLILVLLNAVCGAALALITGFIFTLNLSILLQLMLVGAIAGGGIGIITARNLTWRIWLGRLQSNTPTASAGRLVFGGLMLGLLTGMVFGPLAWLAIAGLFWGFGGLIFWINNATDETETYRSPDRRWWFWWRNRPHLFQVENALRYACTVSPQAREIWTEPLHQLDQAKNQHLPPESLIHLLLSNDWVERFSAAYRLVLQDDLAVPTLEQLARNDTSPLRNTAQWLLMNIAAQDQS
jgi:hypothetical protein